MSRRDRRWNERERRRYAGLCVMCRRPRAPGSTRCEHHERENRENVNRWNARNFGTVRENRPAAPAPGQAPAKTPLSAYAVLPPPGTIALSFFKFR